MNTIANRVADFLKDFPPFTDLSYAELIDISTNIRVVNLEKNKTLFQIDDIPHDSFYVVASGCINLFIISDAEEALLNRCHIGDIFGLRPFFAKNNYMMSAKAREETLLYAIPIAIFRPYVAQNSEVLNFLLESFATNTSNPSDKVNKGKFISDTVVVSEKKSEIHYFQSLSYSKSPLAVLSTSIIRDVAQLMSDNLMDSVLVHQNNNPLGIITDADFRSKIATGRYAITDTISRIMSSPVITVQPSISLPEAQLVMLKNNVTHLCVTQDGTEKTAIKGVISQHDLIVAQANNPGVLIKEIKKAIIPSELKIIREKLTELIQNSISKNIPLPQITNIAGDITIAIMKRSVELAILDIGSPPARFAWLCIGSQGRKEQLVLTDQDSILVFEDVAQDKYREVRDYFLKLSKRVTGIAEKVGFEFCKNDTMASNMLWCKSLNDWIKQYETWINTPSKKNEVPCSIFFDYEIAFGEPLLVESLESKIFLLLKNNQRFFDYLGNDTLRKLPPVSFFKKFNLEEIGPNKDKFDIKNRAILSLVDGARLLALSYNIKGIQSTYLRFKQLSILDSKFSEVYLSCAESFLILSKMRTLEGLKNENSGQYINLEELTKVDRERLKNSFLPIKELEELIKDKFQLTQFS